MSQGIRASFVIDNGKLCGEYYNVKSNNFKETVVDMLYPKIKSMNDHRRTLKQKPWEIHYKLNKSKCYVAITDEGFKGRVTWAFLDDIEKEYMRVSLASTPSVVKKFLKKKMEFYNEPSNDKIVALGNKIEEVKADMIDTLDKVLERDGKLEVMVYKTEQVAETSSAFRVQTRKTKRRMTCVWLALIFAILVIILVVIAAIVLIACGASGCFKKK